MTRPHALLFCTMGTAAIAACTGLGEIGDGSPGDGPASAPSGFAPAPSRLRKLTRTQWQNTVRDLLGVTVDLPKDALEEDSERNGFSAIGASYASISPRGVEKYEAAALDVAHRALSNASKRAALVGCEPTAATDDACTRAFLTKLGRRAYRRPLTAEELERWVGIAIDAQTKLTSFWEGLELAVTGLLTSPNFLYRVELGRPTGKGIAKYDDHEMASRLSFFLRDTTPDDALLDAADRGELGTIEGVERQVARLLEGDGARSSFDGFFGELLHLSPLDTLTRDAKLFPAMTPTLGASMKAETLRLFDDLVFTQDSDVRAMFDARSTFVNADLAKVYGVDAPASGFAKVSLLDRAGILGHASFLAVNAHVGSSSPTYRGKAIRERFLCESIPAPPPSVPPLPDASPGDRATARQRLSMHRENEPCATCHKMMDPIGLGLENYDAVGAFRTKENDATIDPSGDLDGKAFAGPIDLARLLRNDPRVGPCFARNLYRHAAGHVELVGEEPSMKQVIGAFAASGHRVKALALAIVTSDAFRFAQGETP